jgi:hypothetical protein
MKTLAILLATIGVFAIGFGGPWQICASSIYYQWGLCDDTADCGTMCYRDTKVDYFCNFNIDFWCHLDTVQVQVRRDWIDCVLSQPGCACVFANYSHTTYYSWSGGETCNNTHMGP